jgi:hypothetical protein
VVTSGLALRGHQLAQFEFDQTKSPVRALMRTARGGCNGTVMLLQQDPATPAKGKIPYKLVGSIQSTETFEKRRGAQSRSAARHLLLILARRQRTCSTSVVRRRRRERDPSLVALL